MLYEADLRDKTHLGHDAFSRTRYISLEASPEETHQGPHKPSPRRSEYAGDSIGDFFVKALTGFERLLKLNAVRGQAIDHVLPARSLEFGSVVASADLDLEREAQAI
jgi:hypothetical protein